MPRTLIDLSMPVHNDMVVFPRVVRPALVMYETWQEFAERVGAAKFGATSLTASCMIVLGDHVGTHIDSLRHIRETAGGPEAIPIDYCYGDGVVLDFRHLPLGAGISIDDVKSALTKIEYTLKPLDTEAVVRLAKGAKLVATAEDHQIIGGLGSAVAEALADHGVGRPLVRIGLRDVFGESGVPEELLAKHKLDAAGIAEQIRKQLR